MFVRGSEGHSFLIGGGEFRGRVQAVICLLPVYHPTDDHSSRQKGLCWSQILKTLQQSPQHIWKSYNHDEMMRCSQLDALSLSSVTTSSLSSLLFLWHSCYRLWWYLSRLTTSGCPYFHSNKPVKWLLTCPHLSTIDWQTFVLISPETDSAPLAG